MANVAGARRCFTLLSELSEGYSVQTKLIKINQMKTLDLQIKRKPLDIWVQLKQRWSPDEENDFTLPALKRAGRLIRQQFGYRDVLIPPQLRETKWTMHCYVKTRQLLQGCQARCLPNKCDRSPVVYWKAATKFLTHINLRHKPASTQRIQRRADSNRVSANRRWRHNLGVA